MTQTLAPLTAHVNLFRGSYDPHPTAIWTLEAAIRAIRTGTWQNQMSKLRHTLATQGKGLYDHDKKRLDAFSFGGTFAPTRAKEHLTQHSGLAHYDYDHLANHAHAGAVLCAVPFVVYLFTSPSGLGLKVGLRIPVVGTDRGYKHAWQCGADFLEEHTGLSADPSGKDICRLCFVSYDTDAYFNLDAEAFPVPPLPAPMSSPRQSRRDRRGSTRDRHQQYVQQAIDRAIKLIVESTPPTATTLGTRHRSRLKAARLLGGYVGGGFLSYAEAYAILEGIVQQHTAHVSKSMRTIADGLRYGMRTPIHYEDLEGERLAWCAAHGYAPAQREGT
jgi:hypothetical protein